MDRELINRTIEKPVKRHFNVFPVITITGPRQAGKTTLCRKLFPDLPYVNKDESQYY